MNNNQNDFIFTEINENDFELFTSIIYIFLYTLLIVIDAIFLVFAYISGFLPFYHAFIGIFWMIFCIFWIYQLLLSYFHKKRILESLSQYKQPNSSKILDLTNYCLGCMEKISKDMFKQTKNNYIKPNRILLMKGYFCKKCYKKYAFINFLTFFLYFLSIIILYCCLTIIYKGEIDSTSQIMFYALIIIFSIGILLGVIHYICITKRKYN